MAAINLREWNSATYWEIWGSHTGGYEEYYIPRYDGKIE
jgi:hypothetical protein